MNTYFPISYLNKENNKSIPGNHSSSLDQMERGTVFLERNTRLIKTSLFPMLAGALGEVPIEVPTVFWIQTHSSQSLSDKTYKNTHKMPRKEHSTAG